MCVSRRTPYAVCNHDNFRTQHDIDLKVSHDLENGKTKIEFEDGQNRPSRSRDMAFLVKSGQKKVKGQKKVQKVRG